MAKNYNLNNMAFRELKRRAGKDEILAWYATSEKVFIKQPLETKEDFIKLIAFAYSWMPTIPKKVKLNIQSKDWREYKQLIDKLKRSRKVDKQVVILDELFEKIVPVINNSIVGTSKVLHFIAPKKVPIIDSNVITAWNALFNPEDKKDLNNNAIVTLPKKMGSSKNQQKLYLGYYTNIHKWTAAVSSNITIRDIEILLYKYGKKLKEEEKIIETVKSK